LLVVGTPPVVVVVVEDEEDEPVGMVELECDDIEMDDG